MIPTPIPDDPALLIQVFNQMKVDSVASRPRLQLEFRLNQLSLLKKGIMEMLDQFGAALATDLGLSSFMNKFLMGGVIQEIDLSIENLRQWAKPRPVDSKLFLMSKISQVHPQPFGLCLVMGAWNYPIITSLGPTVNAISAGNSVILKPSQISACSSNVMKKLFEKYLDPKYYRVIEGQIQVCKKITSLPFDLIVFTGSPQKGKLVAQAAAQNLTPCILQLGGKSPTIVDADADLENAAMRIASGRFMNCGQTCVAPDFVMVHKDVCKRFCDTIVQTVIDFYGVEPVKSKDIGKIINKFHVDRLSGYLSQDHKGKVLVGGKVIESQRFIEPTIILNPSEESSLMKDQIFGPILPIIQFQEIGKAVSFINSRQKPLALYYFGEQHKFKVGNQVSSGSYAINEAVFQIANLELPFGGVGNSGYGVLHGKCGFDSCSHLKSVFQSYKLNKGPFGARFPPYTQKKQTDMLGSMEKLNYFKEKLKSKAMVALVVLLGLAIALMLRHD